MFSMPFAILRPLTSCYVISIEEVSTVETPHYRSRPSITLGTSCTFFSYPSVCGSEGSRNVAPDILEDRRSAEVSEAVLRCHVDPSMVAKTCHGTSSFSAARPKCGETSPSCVIGWPQIRTHLFHSRCWHTKSSIPPRRCAWSTRMLLSYPSFCNDEA